MVVKKAGGKIYGAVLTSAEKKAMNMEIERQLAEYTRKHEVELNAMILYVLHEQLGFGEQRLKKFFDRFSVEIDALVKYYETRWTRRTPSGSAPESYLIWASTWRSGSPTLKHWAETSCVDFTASLISGKIREVQGGKSFTVCSMFQASNVSMFRRCFSNVSAEIRMITGFSPF